MEIDRRDERVAEAVLLPEARVAPGGVSYQVPHSSTQSATFFSGSSLVHDRRVAGDHLVDPAGLREGRQPFGLG